MRDNTGAAGEHSRRRAAGMSCACVQRLLSAPSGRGAAALVERRTELGEGDAERVGNPGTLVNPGSACDMSQTTYDRE
jgi:hypothetical protein